VFFAFRSIEMADLPELTEETFETTIASGATLVDFWAPWCGPCQVQGPILEEVSTQAPEGAKVAKLNVDDVGAVAAKFGVMSIPTLILFKDGEEIERLVGVQQAPTLLELLKNNV